MAQDDGTLIARVLQCNDQRAYAELVNRYQSRLRYSLRQLTGWDQGLADDLAQETFINAFKNLNKFRGDASFYTWLYRIAYRRFASYYRSRKPTEPLPDLEERNENGSEKNSRMEARDLHRDFAQALAQLPPEQAMAIHLHMHREYSHQEIADTMECPLGTVKSHIQRGREKLKVLLSEWNAAVNP